MASSRHTMPIGRAMRNVTLNIRVTGMGMFKFRFRVVMWLMMLAAWVSPVGTTIESSFGEGE